MSESWKGLKTPQERLRWARKAAKYPTASEAARAMAVPIPTYVAHENSGVGLIKNAVRYAGFFRVDIGWLLTGRGAPKGPTRAHEILGELPPEALAEAADYLEFLRDKRKGEDR